VNITLTIAFVLLGASAVWLWRAEAIRRRTVARLDDVLGHPGAVVVPPIAVVDVVPPAAVYPRRFRWIPPLIGLGTVLVLRLMVALPLPIAVAFGLLSGVLSHLAEDLIASLRMTRIETQLSEAVDLLVSSLQAGAAVLAGFEAALRDSRPPLRAYLQEVVGRVRLGEDPRDVIIAMADQVPLETFRLFAMSLAVHWEVGGSLASTLATVGRTVRDRIELERRVRAQGIEAHLSVGIVLVITYVLAYMMWRSSPERLEAFLQSDIGTALVAIVVGLQAIGLMWMSRVSKSGF
jgi:tight adherence protein B